MSPTVAGAVLQLLGRQGITTAFGIPGVHNLPFWDVDADDAPRIVGVRHEQAACYAADVELYRPPEAEPFLRGRAALADHYGRHRFNRSNLHAELVGRLVVGNKVFDHERIEGLSDQAVEALVAFEVQAGLIRRVWFFDPGG